jgi:hypothetical protein
MVSLPTRGTSLRLTASSATRRTVQRALPFGGLQHTIAIKRCFWLSLPPLRAAVSHTAPAPNRPADNGGRRFECLWCQWNNAGNLWRTYALCQLQKRQSTQHDSDLLDSAAHQLPEFLLILGGHINTQGWTSHTLV